MLITATNHPTRVQYRKPGKQYAHQFPEGRAPENTDERSDYPHDEVDLAVGESFDATGLHVLKLIDMTPSAPSGNDTSMAG